MADDILTVCKRCGGTGAIVAFRASGQLTYCGHCALCGQDAAECTNYDRAVDFWNGWQAQKDEPGGVAPAEPEAEERFDFDLTTEEEDAEEPEDEGPPA